MSKRTREEEKVALDKALTEFANDMRARLHQMVDQGKTGWDDPMIASAIATDMEADAMDAARQHDRTKLHDIANRAMMLWWQSWGMSVKAFDESEPEIREKLAAYAHEAWSGWMRYLFEKCTTKRNGTVVIPKDSVDRWKRQMHTLYQDLPESQKPSDRDEADKMLEIMQAESGNGKEQNIIDICFQIAFMVKDNECVRGMNQEDLAKWIAGELKTCGFPTHPCGSSYAVLDNAH